MLERHCCYASDIMAILMMIRQLLLMAARRKTILITYMLHYAAAIDAAVRCRHDASSHAAACIYTSLRSAYAINTYASQLRYG